MSKRNLHNRKSNDGFRGMTNVVCRGNVVSEHTVVKPRTNQEQMLYGMSVVTAVVKTPVYTMVTVCKLKADGTLSKRLYRSVVGAPNMVGNNKEYCVVNQMHLP